MIRYRALPPECLEPIPVAELGAGATNEVLARAYRDALELARLRASVLAGCRELNGAPAPP